MDILDKLTSPQDIKDLSIDELYRLCDDLRSLILTGTAKNGGHLASNLGVVELTVAIHNVFDTSRDRLVFDVGHQCYAHKILSGRKDKFNTLRSLGGISGFPNPEESIHDAFISGHASTSISVALGMARARTAKNEDYSVIALIGDGALTGGLAYEGLSDAGQSGEPLIILLNDNEMSITENVGGFANHLAYLRMRPYYLSVKKVYRKTIAKIPLFGSGLTRFLRRIKSGVKNALRLPSSMFESMGFKYLGPADGHNIKEICRLLKVAQEMKQPVIIHLKTTKGKGYKPAEDKPEIYHGVPPFDVTNGGPNDTQKDSFGSAFGEAISRIAADDTRICAISAAMQSSTGLDGFADEYPDRFFDVGIAEGHAVTMAGGLAEQGMIPVCAIYSTFIQRSYDMLFHDICLSNLHVVFALDRAGLVADDGQTHQGILDVGMFLQMPNMTVLCPSCTDEVEPMLRYAIYNVKGPVAIRYPRGGGENLVVSNPPYEPMLLKDGEDAAIITYGRLVFNALDAARLLSEEGIDTAVIRLTEIAGACMDKIMPLLGDLTSRKNGILKCFIIEECVASGSVASKLALEAASAETRDVQIIPINLGNSIPPPATIDELMHMYGLDAESIVEKITKCIRQS